MQCDEDYKLFNQLVCDTTEALGKTMSVSTWCRPHMDIPLPVKPDIVSYTTRLSVLITIETPPSCEKWDSMGMRSNLPNSPKGLGISCKLMYSFIAWYVALPILVFHFELTLYQAVGTDVRKIDPNRAMEAFSRSGNAKYILGTVMNNVSRSRYGKQLTQNSTYECRPASKLVTANGEWAWCPVVWAVLMIILCFSRSPGQTQITVRC